MTIRNIILGAVTALAMTTASASALVIETLSLDGPGAGDGFFSSTAQDGTVTIFDVEPLLSANAGLPLISAVLQGVFGLTGNPSTGADVTGDGILAGTCVVSCVNQVFSQEIGTATILDGSNAVLVQFQREDFSGTTVIDNLELVLTFDDSSTVVPLPASAFLLLGGLAALGAVRRFRRNEA